jgi:hypothetical protein
MGACDVPVAAEQSADLATCHHNRLAVTSLIVQIDMTCFLRHDRADRD